MPRRCSGHARRPGTPARRTGTLGPAQAHAAYNATTASIVRAWPRGPRSAAELRWWRGRPRRITRHAPDTTHHHASCVRVRHRSVVRRTARVLRCGAQNTPAHTPAHTPNIHAAGATHPYCSKLSGKRTPRSVESIVNMNRGALAVACGARTPGNRHRGQLAGWLPSRRCLLPRAAANSRLGRDRERSAPRAQRAGAGLLRMPRSNTRPGAKRHSRRLSGHKAQLTHMY